MEKVAKATKQTCFQTDGCFLKDGTSQVGVSGTDTLMKFFYHWWPSVFRPHQPHIRAQSRSVSSSTALEQDRKESTVLISTSSSSWAFFIIVLKSLHHFEVYFRGKIITKSCDWSCKRVWQQCKHNPGHRQLDGAALKKTLKQLLPIMPCQFTQQDVPGHFW